MKCATSLASPRMANFACLKMAEFLLLFIAIISLALTLPRCWTEPDKPKAIYNFGLTDSAVFPNTLLSSTKPISLIGLVVA